MTAYEIAFGVVLIIVSVLIVVFTLSQTQKAAITHNGSRQAQTQKGQGLSAAIMGDSSFMAAGRERGLDAKLAKVTKICGAVFFVATLLVGVLSARL